MRIKSKILKIQIVLFLLGFQVMAQHSTRPNVIFIMADDMGYGDPQCYNPDSKIPTPNMNRLAKEGMVFTDAHAASSVCTPSRYSFITGKYAWRSDLKREVLWSTFNDPLIDKSEVTIADMLKDQGYATAVVGKWHLGINFFKNQGFEYVEAKDWHEKGLKGTRDVNFMNPSYGGPNDLGFDYFFGSGGGHNMEPHVFIENRYTYGLPTIWREKGQPSKEEISASEVHEGWMIEGWDDTEIGPTLTKKSLQFIEENTALGKPFFLYLPTVAPHRPCTPADFAKGKSQAGERGDMVYEFDWALGQIMEKLDALGITDNTLLIVSSDNGGTPTSDDGNDYGHQSCGNLNGFKASLLEGGHRVPFIVRWPNVVPENSTNDGLVSIMDIYATVADIFQVPIATGDGISFLPLLKNNNIKSSRKRMVHHTYSGQYALRDGNWKFIPHRSSKDGSWSFSLFDLSNDPNEKNNLADQYPEKIKAFQVQLEELIRM
ncbi:arylsulfatase [Echinicola sp. CAU 1574]|uniref:Arylsulfatase n=1 Tax=Echinicola arenosa TaxID=2774144 RepID=A0ABR9AI67_9BACT|nr:arylsulfatase [Echinicola arenosa]MBD8488488.1 arylsulfatase [Echinicola arenosa]